MQAPKTGPAKGRSAVLVCPAPATFTDGRSGSDDPATRASATTKTRSTGTVRRVEYGRGAIRLA